MFNCKCSVAKKNRLLCGLSIVAISLACLTTGCAEKSKWDRIAVKGTVTLDGKPFNGGLCLRPQRGVVGPTVSAQSEDGEFRFTTKDGPVVGNHRAILMPQQGGKRDNSVIAQEVTVAEDSAALALSFATPEEPVQPTKRPARGNADNISEK